MNALKPSVGLASREGNMLCITHDNRAIYRGLFGVLVAGTVYGAAASGGCI